MGIFDEELTDVLEIKEHIIEITQSKNIGAKFKLKDMYDAYVKQLRVDTIIEELKEHLSKDDKVLELIFDNKIAVCETENLVGIPFYYCVPSDYKRKDFRICTWDTKEEAVVDYVARMKGKNDFTMAIMNLCGFTYE